jgi:hypothetical protein
VSWSTQPSCHDDAFPPNLLRSWAERDGLRWCSYCGSLHPEDLCNGLEQGRFKLGGADWKYGWPHKFYVSPVGNPGGYVGKFYNEHLTDQGFSGDELRRTLDLLLEHSGIEFQRSQGGELHYIAPYRGYQR